MTVPGSQAKDNTEKVDIDATIDGILLNIKRQDATTGCDKEGKHHGLYFSRADGSGMGC